MLRKTWGNGNPHTLLVGMQISTTTMKNSMEAPQKNIKLPYDLAKPLLGLYLKEYKSGYNKGTC
jgi:hypothetical protein